MGLCSLSFINLTAAVIRGVDLHCRVFMYRNVDCRLDGWVKQAHDLNTKEHYSGTQSNQISKLSLSWEIWIWKPSQICMTRLLGQKELLKPLISIPQCALWNVYTAILQSTKNVLKGRPKRSGNTLGPTSVPHRGCWYDALELFTYTQLLLIGLTEINCHMVIWHALWDLRSQGTFLVCIVGNPALQICSDR